VVSAYRNLGKSATVSPSCLRERVRQKRVRILYIVHNFPPYEHTGAPFLARQWATLALESGASVGVAFEAGPESGVKASLQADGLYLFPLQGPRDRWVPGWTLDAYIAPPAESSSISALKEFQPDVIHIIEWVNLPSAVMALSKSLQVPVIRHICGTDDICTFINPIMFHPHGGLCREPLSVEQCSECLIRNLPNLSGEPGEDGAAWLRLRKAEYASKLTAKWDVFRVHLSEVYSELIFLTDSFRQYFESIFDVGRIRRSVISHGIPRPAKSLTTRVRSPGAPIRFVFLGPCSTAKGWNAIEDAFVSLLPAARGRFALSVYNSGYVTSDSRLRGRAEVDFHQGFASLDEILTDCDVGLIPSRFETFSRTCHEFLIRGIPAIGSDAFGISDVIQHRHNGIQVGRPTAANLLDAVKAILEEDNLLDQLTTGARKTNIKTDKEEFSQLFELYELDIKRLKESATRLSP
jgi:glycosyltransferase involved in cell wall biosynthesis